MKLNSIEFIFENCDCIEISGAYVGDFIVDDIVTSIQRIACNSIEEMQTAKTIAMEIHKDANKPRYEFEQEQINSFRQMTFDRFTAYNDVTAIEFELFNEHTNELKHFHYYVDWCGDSDYENSAQSVYISKQGNLYLVIKDGMNVLNMFDVENIDDEEYMNYKFSMYDLEGDKDE